MNTDQGSQFSAQAFVHAVKEQGCHLSMDGRGRWHNQSRPHSSLARHTPDEAYAVMLPTGKLAA